MPRDHTRDGAVRDTGMAQRVQALVSASGSADPVAIAWVRDRPGGPVRVLAAGSALAGGHDGGQTVLTFPAGARAASLQPGQSILMLTALPCWTRISGFTDVLRAERSQRRRLAIIAHLTGWPVPRPVPSFTADLRAIGGRRLDCALAHATGAAVAARVPAISARISPDALAVHITAVIRELAGGTVVCESEEPRYLAPAFQWVMVVDALRETCQAGVTAGPHPSTSRWEQRYGRQVPGRTCEEQLRAVHRWHARAQRDTGAITVIIWGSRPHTAIGQAVAGHVTDDTWTSQLTGALDAFTQAGWTSSLLTVSPGQGGGRA